MANFQNYFKIKGFSNEEIRKIVKIKNKNNKLNENQIEISLKNIKNQFFTSLSLDFDGTLIDLNDRNAKISKEILNQLRKFHEHNIPVFILTGRGSSLLNQFDSIGLNPNLLFFGQYNGGKIIHNNQIIFEVNIKEIRSYNLAKMILNKNSCEFSEKKSMFKCKIDSERKFLVIKQELLKLEDWKIFNQKKTFDVVPNYISKLYALNKCTEILGINPFNSLKIGDSGSVGGNDYELLESGNSFSLGSYSQTPDRNFPVCNRHNQLKGVEGLKFILGRIIF